MKESSGTISGDSRTKSRDLLLHSRLVLHTSGDVCPCSVLLVILRILKTIIISKEYPSEVINVKTIKDDPEQCCFIPLTASLRKVSRKLDDLDTTLIKFLRSVQLIVQVLDAVDVPSSLVVPAAAAQYTLPDLCDISIQTKIIHITLRLIYIPYLVYLNVSPATHNNAPSHIERRGFWKTSLSDLWWLQRRQIYAIQITISLNNWWAIYCSECLLFNTEGLQVILRGEDVGRHQDICIWSVRSCQEPETDKYQSGSRSQN